jgi:hypothetical protein
MITRAPGAAHRQEIGADTMQRLIGSAGRKPEQRKTD